MNKEIKDLYSHQYRTVNGNYGFIDLKENGSLSVKHSKKKEDGGFERDSFTISHDSMKEICEILSNRGLL